MQTISFFRIGCTSSNTLTIIMANVANIMLSTVYMHVLVARSYQSKLHFQLVDEVHTVPIDTVPT